LLDVFEDKPAKWPIAKKETHQNIHPQLIHMTLQEGLVNKDI
jgi:hypothetical protein